MSNVILSKQLTSMVYYTYQRLKYGWSLQGTHHGSVIGKARFKTVSCDYENQIYQYFKTTA